MSDPPTAKINNSLHIVSLGDRAQVFCILDGNPLLASHVTWKLNGKPQPLGNDEFYQTRLVSSSLAVLVVRSARDLDDGELSCHVANGVGNASVATTELRVKRKPQIIHEASMLKAGEDSNIGRSAQFKCLARAYPDATFKWKKASSENGGGGGGGVDLANSTKYTVSLERGGGGGGGGSSSSERQTFVSTLTVHSVTSVDYGDYLCEARNDMGSTLAKALLSGKHQPEQPVEFRVLNITRSSIGLAWRKRFDGGEPQKFLVRYRKDTLDPTYKYVESEVDASGLVLEQLEPATRYVVNIQSLNKFGTEGFLREPLIVQTDFGFNSVSSSSSSSNSDGVNQMPITMFGSGNDLPLTVILMICSVGTLVMLVNVMFIVFFIRRKKRKGEAGV